MKQNALNGHGEGGVPDRVTKRDSLVEKEKTAREKMGGRRKHDGVYGQK